MRVRSFRWRLPVVAAGLAALCALLVWQARSSERRTASPAAIAVFTTLPLLWSETDNLADLLRDQAPSHWAKAVIEQRGPIRPLDTLDGTLSGVGRLLMAQPRALTPAENVALDRWVRRGGRVLLLADPALAQESHYPVGDPRRPQAMALLSPILTRWGLELTFDDQQPLASGNLRLLGQRVHTVLAGRWRLLPGNACRVIDNPVLVQCRIGAGTVLAMADAEIVSTEAPALTRKAALGALMDQAFSAP